MNSHLLERVATAAPSAEAKLPPSCRIEPLEDIRASFIDRFQKKRIEQGEKPAERAVFRKQHGVAKGKLSVVEACPPKYRVGLWAGDLMMSGCAGRAMPRPALRTRKTTRSASPSSFSA